MLISKLLEDGIKVANLGDIPLSNCGLYFVEYVNKDSTNQNKEYALYDIECGIGVIKGCFHFDVVDTFVDITYIKLEL